MYVCYLYMCVYIYQYVCVYVSGVPHGSRRKICMHAWMYIRTYVCVRMFKCVRYLYMNASIYKYGLYVCIYKCVCVCTYAGFHTGPGGRCVCTYVCM
jgi:hypothetical protein